MKSIDTANREHASFKSGTKCMQKCFSEILVHIGNYQPRPQGFSLKKWVGRENFKGKALGTRLGNYSMKNNTKK